MNHRDFTFPDLPPLEQRQKAYHDKLMAEVAALNALPVMHPRRIRARQYAEARRNAKRDELERRKENFEPLFDIPQKEEWL